MSRARDAISHAFRFWRGAKKDVLRTLEKGGDIDAKVGADWPFSPASWERICKERLEEMLLLHMDRVLEEHEKLRATLAIIYNRIGDREGYPMYSRDGGQQIRDDIRHALEQIESDETIPENPEDTIRVVRRVTVPEYQRNIVCKALGWYTTLPDETLANLQEPLDTIGMLRDGMRLPNGTEVTDTGLGGEIHAWSIHEKAVASSKLAEQSRRDGFDLPVLTATRRVLYAISSTSGNWRARSDAIEAIQVVILAIDILTAA